MNGSVRIGVIGLGRWAMRHHLPALKANPRATITAAADPDPAKRERASRLFGIQNRYASAPELLADGKADGVIIAVPHPAHYEVARAALDSGIHVLLEKPMTLNGSEAWDLVRRSRSRSLHLILGYTYHFTESAARARQLVYGGVLGSLTLIGATFDTSRAHLYRPAAIRTENDPDPATYADPAGGGQGHTEATHALANLLYISGLKVKRVSALMRALDYPVDVADALLLEFGGGAIGTLATIGELPPGQPEHREFRYHGRKGVLIQDLTTGELTGSVARHQIHYPPVVRASRYPSGLPSACLVDLMMGGWHNPAPADLGAEVVSCLEAAYHSARNGGIAVGVKETI